MQCDRVQAECNEWRKEVCGDPDLVTIALPGATHTCHFLPPAPLLTLLSRASAPPPAAQVWRTHPAYPLVQVETTLHLVQTSMPLLLIPPWVQVHQSSPQLLVTSLGNIKPHKCPCYICQCTCLNRCPCICSCTSPVCTYLLFICREPDVCDDLFLLLPSPDQDHQL